MRNALAHAADQLRERQSKLGKLMGDSKQGVLACMAFPASHRTKPRSTNPLERLDKEVKRRAGAVGLFPSGQSIIAAIGTLLLKANDEWQPQHRRMGVEAMCEVPNPTPTDENPVTATQGSLSHGRLKPRNKSHHVDGRNPATAGKILLLLRKSRVRL